MFGRLKQAAEMPMASSTGATAASPIPTPSIDPTLASGKKGPAGLSPRTNYSRVNTGAPPAMDAGADAQKSLPPRGAEMLPKRASAGETSMGKMAGRPMLQDLVKAAMVDSAARVSVSREAALQEGKTASEKCGSCGMAMSEGHKCSSKTASADKLAGAHVEKLAAALDFIAEEIVKEGSMGGAYTLKENLITSPPGVSHSSVSGQLPDHKGEGVHTVPMHPGMQKELKAEHGATQMENTLNHPSGAGQKMIQKNASPLDLIRAKLASNENEKHEKKETEGLAEAKKGLEEAEKAHKSEPENKEAGFDALATELASRIKQAEDAINPAKITAGAAVAPQTSAAGQTGGAPAGGSPQGPTGLVASADSARHYTRGQAYANRKDDLKKYFAEPAMSAEHDKVLQVAFQHTGQAGPKIASAEGALPAAAESVKTASAKALLSKLAEAATEDAKRKDVAQGTA